MVLWRVLWLEMALVGSTSDTASGTPIEDAGSFSFCAYFSQ
jgi:hypothetical protein